MQTPPHSLSMQSKDGATERLRLFRQLFPEALTESIDEEGKAIPAIDADKLSQLLASCVVEGKDERYQFTWPDKRKAIRSANVPTTSCLRPYREESVEFDTTQNLYLEGDNLEVLKVLRESYLGKVKMIYIDPPYNTGKDFVYNDDFTQDSDEYKGNSGQQDEQGNRLVLNTETNGRYHTDWLNMMYPRLKVARDFLSDDGVIFISIDDNEVTNLRRICDEIFGEGNFVGQLVWERAFAPKNDARFISNSHDYVVMYAKSLDNFKIGRLPRTEEANSRYSNPDNDPRGVWMSSDISVKTYNAECDYQITTPSGRVVEPPTGRCWRLSKKAFSERLNDNRIWFGPQGDGVPRLKRFLSELKFDGMAPTSILFHKEVGHSQEGTQELSKLLGGGFFDGPKPVRLLNRLLILGNLKEGDIVIDFFSGSATTAQAVMQLNAEDGGNRRFVMVQLQEACDEKSEAFKAGSKNICDIGKERIRRAGRKIKEESGKDLDIGFRVLKCDSSNMADVFYHPHDIALNPELLQADNIKADRSADDLLFQIMPELNIPLSASVETVELGGRSVYRVQDGYLFAVLDGVLTDECMRALAEQHAPYIATRNSCFGSDADAINLEQYLRAISPETQLYIL